MKRLIRLIGKHKSIAFEPIELSRKDEVIEAIVSNLSPDLLAENRFLTENSSNPMYGHCFHSSQAFYYLVAAHNFTPMFAFNDYRGGTHWWLQNDDEILDITADQYYSIGEDPPYENGSPRVWKPARRTFTLIERVFETLKDGYFEKIV